MSCEPKDTSNLLQWSVLGKLILILFPIALFFFAFLTAIDLKQQLPSQGNEPEMFFVLMTFAVFMTQIGSLILLACAIFKLLAGPSANWPQFMLKNNIQEPI